MKNVTVLYFLFIDKSHMNKLWITFIFRNLLKDVRKINVTFEYTLKFFHNPTLHNFYLSFASIAFKLYFSIAFLFKTFSLSSYFISSPIVFFSATFALYRDQIFSVKGNKTPFS